MGLQPVDGHDGTANSNSSLSIPQSESRGTAFPRGIRKIESVTAAAANPCARMPNTPCRLGWASLLLGNEIAAESVGAAKEGAMERGRPNILLVGETVQGSSFLASLHRRGCECSSAASCREAFLILRKREFDLVLCPMRLRDGSLYPVMRLLEGSSTTMFYFHPVERGCWWLPALRRGQMCLGSAACRGKDFVILLDETIKQIQRDALAAVER